MKVWLLRDIFFCRLGGCSCTFANCAYFHWWNGWLCRLACWHMDTGQLDRWQCVTQPAICAKCVRISKFRPHRIEPDTIKDTELIVERNISFVNNHRAHSRKWKMRRERASASFANNQTKSVYCIFIEVRPERCLLFIEQYIPICLCQ